MYPTFENIAVKLLGYAYWITFLPVSFFSVPGHELAVIVFKSLYMLLCLLFLAKIRKKKFPWIRMWPLYGVATCLMVLETSSFYFLSNSPKIYSIVLAVCVISNFTCACFMTNIDLLVQNAALSDDSEVVSTYNDEKIYDKSES